jgi:hypothetical protein
MKKISQICILVVFLTGGCKNFFADPSDVRDNSQQQPAADSNAVVSNWSPKDRPFMSGLNTFLADLGRQKFTLQAGTDQSSVEIVDELIKSAGAIVNVGGVVMNSGYEINFYVANGPQTIRIDGFRTAESTVWKMQRTVLNMAASNPDPKRHQVTSNDTTYVAKTVLLAWQDCSQTLVCKDFFAGMGDNPGDIVRPAPNQLQILVPGKFMLLTVKNNKVYHEVIQQR